MTGDSICHETRPGGGRYVLTLDGAAAELTYTRLDDRTIRADHTGVPPIHRGRGTAARLVERLVADARADGLLIVPACSYVAMQRDRHPEWAEVFARDPA